MGIFDHFDADDAANTLEDLGEPVTWVKRNSAGLIVERREIDAIVHRQPNRLDRETATGARTAKIKPIRIVFANGGCRGVSASELDVGLDRIELETVHGDPNTKRELKLQTPRENERTQNDARFFTFELY